MRLHADFAERGTANSVHGMNAEGDVVNCFRTAESTRIGGCMRPNNKFIHEKRYAYQLSILMELAGSSSRSAERASARRFLASRSESGMNGVEHNEHLR